MQTMYESFFGLTAKPFSLVPDPRFLFLSRTHQKALRYLDYGLREEAGFILLTGEVGSGKTTIVKNFISRLDGSTVLAMIFNTCIGGDQLLAAINEEFGLDIRGCDKLTLQRDLNDFLIAQYAMGVRPILIIDEAQNLPAESLEEIRLLSNLEARDNKLLQIILIGQPELKETLDQHHMRQLRQRIGVSCHLSPLSPEEIEDYIFYRLGQAGNREAVTFEEGAFEIIHRYSGGIPRLVNRICDFLLLSAFCEEKRHFPLDLVSEVAAEAGDVAAADSIRSGGASELSSLEERLKCLEDDVTRFLSGNLEKERIFERLSLIEKALKRSHCKQHEQFNSLEERLSRLEVKVEDLQKGRGLSVVK
jgi:putative secretion ATPase (PEP-CTERM system associated)